MCVAGRRGERAATGVVGGIEAGVVDRDDITGRPAHGPLLGVISAYVHRVAFVEKIFSL